MIRVRMAGAFLMAALASVLTSGASAEVVAYWPFGTNGVRDVSGNGHDLVNGGVVFSGGTAVFSGTQSAFNTAGTLDLSAYGAITVECFVRTPTASGCIVFEHTEVCNDNPGGFLSSLGDLVGPGTVAGAFRTSAAGSFNIEATPLGAASDGQWHHVALVIDSSKDGADRLQLYFDKVRQAKLWGLSDASVTPFLDATFYIGSRANASAKFAGQLDDVRITGRALSVGEFLQVPTLSDEVAYWPFTPGAETDDATGNGNALTNSGVAFARGFAAFGGTQEVFSTIGSLDLRWCPALTVEYFIRSPAASGGMVLEHTEVCNNNPGGFLLESGLNGGPGSVSAAFVTANGYNIEITPDGAASDGQWHHVAMVIDPSKDGTDRLQLYFDCVRQAKYFGLSDASVTPFLNATLYIGSRANTASKFSGQLDDVRVTGRALTTNEFLKTPTVVLSQGVLAYWPFEPGAELADASGNGNALSNQGVSFQGGAAVFSGAQTVFSTASDLDLSLHTSLTVEYFIRTASTENSLVLEHSTNTTLCVGAFCSALGESNVPGLLTGAIKTSPEDSGYNIEATAADAASDDRWHHVALVVDASKAGADRAQLYFDKVRQSTYAGYADDTATAFRNATLYIGSRANSVYKFSGRLDDVRITGAALAPAQFMRFRSDPARGTALLVL